MAESNERDIQLLNRSIPDTDLQTVTSEVTNEVSNADEERSNANTENAMNGHVNPEFNENEEIFDANLQQQQQYVNATFVDVVPDTASAATPSAPETPYPWRSATRDELIFRLRLAHLTPGTDWFQEVSSSCDVNNDPGGYEYVLTNLRDYPLTIRQKVLLSRQIRARLDATSLASSLANLTTSKQDLLHQRRTKKTRKAHTWKYGLADPFGIWEHNIGKISAYFGSHVASYFQFVRFLTLMNAGIGVIMFLFVSLPQIVTGEVWSDEVQAGFFGDLSHTIFFYGAYHNTSSTASSIHLSYNRPLAYLMTWSAVNVLAILIIVVSMYISYRRIKKAGDARDDTFSSHAFLSWDHSVTSHEGSKIRSYAITTQIKELIREEKSRRQLTTRERLNLWCVRVVFNFVSVAVLAASAYLIYFVAGESITPGVYVPEVIGDFLEKYLLTVLVTGLKVVVPPVLSLIMILERYHPRTRIKLQIARTAVFYVASLVVFLASIYSISTQCLTRTEAKVGYQNFNVPEFVLDLVYGQALIWLSLFFAPFLALVGVVKLVILFYFNYVLARKCCVPSNKVFRASRSGTFYLFVLLLTEFACLFPMTYAIVQLEPSTSCGPFKMDSHVYLVLTEEIGVLPSWLQDIFHYASTPAVVIPIIIVLLLLCLYFHVKSVVLEMEAKELRQVLQFERKVEKRRVFSTAKLHHSVSVMSGLDA